MRQKTNQRAPRKFTAGTDRGAAAVRASAEESYLNPIESGERNNLPGQKSSIAERRHSAFMAVRTLLGVEILWSDAKHVVALDANAMKHAFGVPRRCAFVGSRCGRRRCSLSRFTHKYILAQPGHVRAVTRRAARWPPAVTPQHHG